MYICDMEAIIILIIATACSCLLSLYFCMRGYFCLREELSFYEDLYRKTDELAGVFRKIAADAIKNTDEVLDTSEKLIEALENREFLIDLFLDGVNSEVADELNGKIMSRGMRIRFDEGKWKLFVKSDA